MASPLDPRTLRAVIVKVFPDLATGVFTPQARGWCPPFASYHLYYPSRHNRQSAAFALLVEALRYRGAMSS